jgi:hypothetical protein
MFLTRRRDGMRMRFLTTYFWCLFKRQGAGPDPVRCFAPTTAPQIRFRVALALGLITVAPTPGLVVRWVDRLGGQL